MEIINTNNAMENTKNKGHVTLPVEEYNKLFVVYNNIEGKEVAVFCYGQPKKENEIELLNKLAKNNEKLSSENATLKFKNNSLKSEINFLTKKIFRFNLLELISWWYEKRKLFKNQKDDE